MDATDLPTAYDAEHLHELLSANKNCPPNVTGEMVEMIVDAIRERDGIETAFDSLDHVQLVFTDWDKFCRQKFGESRRHGNEIPNRFAVCKIDFDVSDGRDAWLCKEADAVQMGWLLSGDGRKTKLSPIDQSDTEHVNDARTFWAPKEYVSVVTIHADCLAPDTDAVAADAM